MRQKVSAVVLLLTVLQLIAAQGDECYQNEFFSTNSNPCNTCEDRGYCPGEDPGCDCVEGYFKDRQGICVPEAECGVDARSYKTPDPPPTLRCGPNEEYSDCGNSCPPTCRNWAPTCDLKCVSGCFCIRGYVRRNNRCIPQKECPNTRPPPRCGMNEIFSECGSACPETCAIRRPVCTSQCVRGCVCRPKYVRKNGRCVHRSQCDVPPVCPTPPPPVCPPATGTCPDRQKCNKSCRKKGFSIGFCVSEAFKECKCSGRRTVVEE